MRKKWAVGSGRWAVKAFARKLGLSSSRFKVAGTQSLPTARCPLPASSRGFTLIELVITLTVLTILTMGVIPLIKVSVKRQREQRLRDELRMMRMAIDQFHREALAGPQGQQGQQAQTPQQQQQQQQAQIVDPRIRVAITDNTIFGVDNPDRYPPDLETLVNGVSVTPIGANLPTGGPNGPNATDNTLTSTKKKIYLREIPIDPMTGERDWELRSTYDSKDTGSWGGENVFDVRSKSTATALDGSKYSEW
jgi:general secretion pathway protein G